MPCSEKECRARGVESAGVAFSWTESPDPPGARRLPRVRPTGPGLVQYAWHGEDEFGNFGLKVGAVFRHHLIPPLHCADGGVEDRTAGVFKRLAWFKKGLLADDAQTTNFLNRPMGIRDDPMS